MPLFSSALARWLGAAACLLAANTGLHQALAAPATPDEGLAGLARRYNNSSSTGSGHTSKDKLVFCHFMIGIVGLRQGPSDFDEDMKLAKSMGIDAFALNIGVDTYTDTQLGYAYQSAAKNGMNVFISFDFNWYTTAQAADIGAMIKKYGSNPAQLTIDGAIVASSFSGDGVDVGALRAAAGCNVFWAPNFHPSQGTQASTVDAALNWMAWPNNGHNKAPDGLGNFTVEDGDSAYMTWLGTKPYIAPVSAWFSTHFGPEVSFSKNWVFPSDLLWYQRWTHILELQPQYLEIVTWNDYGESHYIGPLDSPHNDDGNSKWVNDMPHDGLRYMAQPFIAAFKAGDKTVDKYITSDQLVYWYRPTPKMVGCDSTDTTMAPASNASGNYFMGRPYGYGIMEDDVFVVTLLKQAATVTVTSGCNQAYTYNAPAGVYAQAVPMGVGKQSFSVSRGGKVLMSETSPKEVSNSCICGIYNFNVFVGSLPGVDFGVLDFAGCSSMTVGLHVSTCSPTPAGPATASATAPAAGHAYTTGAAS